MHEVHRGRGLGHPSFAMLRWSNNVLIAASSSRRQTGYFWDQKAAAAAAKPPDMISKSPVAFNLSLSLFPSYVCSEIFRLIDSVRVILDWSRLLWLHCACVRN